MSKGGKAERSGLRLHFLTNRQDMTCLLGSSFLMTAAGVPKSRKTGARNYKKGKVEKGGMRDGSTSMTPSPRGH